MALLCWSKSATWINVCWSKIQMKFSQRRPVTAWGQNKQSVCLLLVFVFSLFVFVFFCCCNCIVNFCIFCIGLFLYLYICISMYIWNEILTKGRCDRWRTKQTKLFKCLKFLWGMVLAFSKLIWTREISKETFCDRGMRYIFIQSVFFLVFTNHAWRTISKKQITKFEGLESSLKRKSLLTCLGDSFLHWNYKTLSCLTDSIYVYPG